MKNFKIIAVTLLAVCLTTKVYSQGIVSVHFGPAIPVLDFGSGDMDDEDAGGAAVGLNIGLKYVYPLSESGIGFFGGVDFHYNGLKQGVKDDVEKFYRGLGINNADIKFYRYINVPVTAGLNFTNTVDEKVSLFANAGLAINFLKITDMVVKANGQTVTTSMDLASNVGFRLGGGVLIDDKYSVSLDYMGLGTHDIKGRVKVLGMSQDIDVKGKIDIINLTFGVRF